MKFRTYVRAVVPVAVTLLLVAGCAGDDDPDSGSDSADSSEATEDPGDEPTAEPTEPPEPPPAPTLHACYRFTADQASQAHADVSPLPCQENHTSQTYFVGTLDKATIGDPEAVRAEKVAAMVNTRCEQTLAEHIGGDEDTRTLSRLDYEWFTPAEEDFALGAKWFRCDLVARLSGDRLARLPNASKDLLAGDDALRTWGTCDQADGDLLNAEEAWRLCSESHNWRAISVVWLGDVETTWPGVDALKARESDCEPSVRNYLDDPVGPLSALWSHPTEQQWRDGRRYGFCWVAES